MPRPPLSDADLRAIFGPETGQRLLAHLKYVCWHDISTYEPGIDALDLAYREGQRSVIVQLLATVEAALATPDEVQEAYYGLGQPQEDHYA